MNLSALFVSFLLGYLVFNVYAGDASENISLVAAPAGKPSHAPRLFDVTDYGAIADGKTENSRAFMRAWEDACGYSGSCIFYIPQGTFFIGSASFSGPCSGGRSPRVVILGTLKAPTSLAALSPGEWIEFRNLQHLTLTGGHVAAVLDAQGGATWSQAPCRLHSKNCTMLPVSLRLTHISNGTISNITVLNSKSFNIAVHGCDNLHLSRLNITAPGNSPNTDGIHISKSTNITVSASDIGVGDDCVSIGQGAVNVTVSDVRCGPGHGISVGSLGKYKDEENVERVRVKNCVINGTQNGVRVKTWQGENGSINVTAMTFENIVLVNVSNPIIIDQEYCPSHTCANEKPSGVKLKDISFKNVSGSYSSQFALTVISSSTKPCENIVVSDVNLSSTRPDTKHLGRLNFKGPVSGVHILHSKF